MDKNKKTAVMKVIERTMENLRKNNMAAFYADTKENVCPIVESLLKDGDTVTHGGSVSLSDCGLTELLNSGRYNYLDRSKAKSPDEIKKIYRQAFFADTYISGTNAIIESGMLYNVDKNSNRIAPIAFGPESVIIIAGYNKIVKNFDEAVERVRGEAAPANCIRLNCNTPCTEKGECIMRGKGCETLGQNCGGNTICGNYLLQSTQAIKDRIRVIIVGEEVGL